MCVTAVASVLVFRLCVKSVLPAGESSTIWGCVWLSGCCLGWSTILCRWGWSRGGGGCHAGSSFYWSGANIAFLCGSLDYEGGNVCSSLFTMGILTLIFQYYPWLWDKIPFWFITVWIFMNVQTYKRLTRIWSSGCGRPKSSVDCS